MDSRTRKLKQNTITSLLNRFARLVSGLVLPRFILLYFGSETNGLVASINQFLNIITFLDLGVGAVIQAALYRPLAQKNSEQISIVLAAARDYFKKIAYVLIAYVMGLIIFYPIIVDPSLDFLSTGILIFALSLSLFGQYYFGIVNQLLLNAHQKVYIQAGSEIVVIILNLLASIFLIMQGASIQIVKLVAGLIFLIRPLYLAYYVNKNYDIDKDVQITEDPLPQKWSGMGQHIAYTIHNSTDVVIVSVFSTLENVSIYSVYNMVAGALKMLLSSFTTGLQSFFGSLLANDEIDLLNSYFSRIEWLIHTGVVFLFGMAAVLINSFVMLYTTGVEDIDYYAPLFSFLLITANLVYSIRIPYRTLVFSAGHFNQTEKSSYVEAAINIVISLLLINQYGLVGIAIGTLIAMLYQTIYLVIYLSKNVVRRPIAHFIKHSCVDIVTYGSMLFIGYVTQNFIQIRSLLDWVLVAALLGIAFIILIIIINSVFYRDVMISTIKSVLKRT